MRKTQVLNLHKKGMSQSQIASELGVSRQYVSQTLKQSGQPPKRDPERMTRIVALHAQGFPNGEIATLENVSHAYVTATLKRFGLERNSVSIFNRSKPKEFCRHGHKFEEVGRRISGHCSECHRIQARESRRKLLQEKLDKITRKEKEKNGKR